MDQFALNIFPDEGNFSVGDISKDVIHTQYHMHEQYNWCRATHILRYNSVCARFLLKL